MNAREQRLLYLAHQTGVSFSKAATTVAKIAAMEDDFAHRIAAIGQDAFLAAADGERAQEAALAIKDHAIGHSQAMATLLDALVDALAECATLMRKAS